MTANDIIDTLIARPINCPVPYWIARAACYHCPPGGQPDDRIVQFYETTAVNFFTEVTTRIPQPGKTRHGKSHFQRRRLDLVALVQPHYRQWRPFAIGVEIKVDLHDLRNDQKMGQYMDYCHLFYLAIPDDLEDEAIGFLEGNMGLMLAGLLVVSDRVEESKKPGHLFPSDKNIAELYAELLIRPFKLARKECKLFVQNERF